MLVNGARCGVAPGLVLALLVCGACSQSETAGSLTVSGPFLGQEQPGLTPEVFAPGIVSTNAYEGCAVFLDEGRIFVFSRLAQGIENWVHLPIYVMKNHGTVWSSAVPATFQKGHPDDNFTAAPDGKTLYFQSHRPTDGSSEPPQYSSIWRVTWSDGDWAEPQVVVSSKDQPLGGGYPSITRDGTLYFMSGRYEGYGDLDIYRSRLIDGKYGPPENLGPQVNSENIELDSFVAADGSYLLFCSDRPGGHNGEYDLYVSFRREDGSWGEAINMGPEINNGVPMTRPNVTPDGRFLFFCRHPGNTDTVYWVDARIIEQARTPKS